jgi:hypothetical protein
MSRSRRNKESKESKEEKGDSFVTSALAKVPPEYKYPIESFDALPRVLEIQQNESDPRDQLTARVRSSTEAMEDAMKILVKKYFEGFTGSIPRFASIIKTMSFNQNTIQTLKQQLAQEKGIFLLAQTQDLQSSLLHLFELEERLKIYTEIARVKEISEAVPRMLQSANGRPDFLGVAKMLVEASAILFHDDLIPIPALVDLRQQMLEVKNSFYELLSDYFIECSYGRDSSKLTTTESLAQIKQIISVSRCARARVCVCVCVCACVRACVLR